MFQHKYPVKSCAVGSSVAAIYAALVRLTISRSSSPAAPHFLQPSMQCTSTYKGSMTKHHTLSRVISSCSTKALAPKISDSQQQLAKLEVLDFVILSKSRCKSLLLEEKPLIPFKSFVIYVGAFFPSSIYQLLFHPKSFLILFQL